MRPVIVGMNNPLSERPEYALAPFPENCTGWRIWQMLQQAQRERGTWLWQRSEYMEGFERINVLNSRRWSASEAAASAQRLAPYLGNRVVVLCGVAVQKALRVPRSPWCEWTESEPRPGGLLEPEDRSFRYVIIPHPSGRCRKYNDEAMVRRVGGVLLEALAGGPD